jgi:hypothetical protein
MLALSTGLVGVIRSREWARRRESGPLLYAVLRCLPYVVAAAAVLFARLTTVPWSVWWETWPPFAVAYPVVLVAMAGIVTARILGLAAVRRRLI